MLNKFKVTTVIAMVLLLTGSLFAQKMTITTSSPEALKAFNESYDHFHNLRNQQIGAATDRALELDPNFAMALMMKSVTVAGDAGKALLTKATEQKVSKEEQMYLKACVFSRDRDDENAIKVLQKLSKRVPDDERVLTFLAALQQRHGDTEAALKNFAKAEKLVPGLPYAVQNMATANLLKGEYAKARKSYKSLIKNMDQDASPFLPFFGTAWTYLYEGHPDKAIAVVDKYLARYNRNGAAQGFPPVWIWNHKGRIYLESGQLEKAMRCYEVGYKSVQPSQIDSTQKLIWLGRMQHGRARTLAKMGKIDEAWAIAENVKKMIEEGGEQGAQFWPRYHYLAGYIKLEAGDYAAAIEHLRQADETNAFHHLLLARAYYKSGDSKNARIAYQEITENKRNNIERALAYPEAVNILAKLGTN